MAVVLLLVIISISYIVVRVGAVALELTGVEREQANFQALSAFTNSGFTTREAEEMVRHPVRRRIISFLMIVGNAGMVTTIGTFAKSVMDGDVARTTLNLAIILAGLTVLIWLARWRGLTRRMHDTLQSWLAHRYIRAPSTTEDLLRVGQGFGLVRVKILETSPLAGRQLHELDLKTRQVQVLAIERRGRFLPVPIGEDRIEVGDDLVVYGTDMQVHRVFQPDATSPLKIKETGHG